LYDSTAALADESEPSASAAMTSDNMERFMV
jgi:hypothetical protein